MRFDGLSLLALPFALTACIKSQPETEKAPPYNEGELRFELVQELDKKIHAAHWAEGQVGYATGEGLTFFKYIPGENWKLVGGMPLPIPAGVWASMGSMRMIHVLSEDEILVWKFSDPLGASPLAGMDGFKSSDGGETWEEIHVEEGVSPDLKGVHFTSGSHGRAFSGSTLLETTDGGLNWRKTGEAAIDINPRRYVNNGVLHLDGNNIIAVGNTNASVNSRGVILKSSDKGATWESAWDPAFTPHGPISSIARNPDGRIFVGGEHGFLYSDDEGDTWLKHEAENLPPVNYNDSDPLRFVDAIHFWDRIGVCNSNSSANGLITLDGGVSWKRPAVSTTPSHLKGGWSGFGLFLPSPEEGRFHAFVVDGNTSLWYKGEILHD